MSIDVCARGVTGRADRGPGDRAVGLAHVTTGARGAARADIDALAGAIVRLSALALDLKDLVAELDINPLFVFAEGKGVKAGDALIKPLVRD